MLVIGVALVVAAACASSVPGPSAGPPQSSPPQPPGAASQFPVQESQSTGGPTPTGVASPGSELWTAADVEESTAVTDAPPSPPVFCSPCHGTSITLLFGVAPTPHGWLAVGLEEPPAEAAIWSSPDARTWRRIEGFPAANGSVALAVASIGQRVVVAGRDNAGAISWASTDGVQWSVAPPAGALEGPAGATRMTSVVAWKNRFVAAGYSDDPAHNTETAAVWSSTDGLTWQRVGIGNPAFQAAHVLGLAASAAGLVAIGTTGSETRGTGVAWSSPDGTAWTRSASAALANGIPRAVTPFGSGFAAVGLRAQDDGALSWTSGAGSAWDAAPDQPSLRVGTSPARMMGLAAVNGGLVGVGWKSDAGNGSAAAWRTADGLTWQRDTQPPSFSGAEMTAVVASDAGLVAVGTAGYPDNDAAAIWFGQP